MAQAKPSRVKAAMKSVKIPVSKPAADSGKTASNLRTRLNRKKSQIGF